MPDKSSLQFPSQKLSKSKKTKKWAEDCIKAAEDLAIFRYSGIRESYRNKLINYNLANDVLDIADLESGIYFIQAYNQNGIVQTAQFIKE